jgi:hypothetical protein
VVGVAGFWATVRTNGKTLQAARDEKIWDKRAEAYADAIAAVHYRQQKREHDTRTYRLDDETERRDQAYLDAFTAPDWYALEARLVAFGSLVVVTSVQESSTAHFRALAAFRAWAAAADKTRADNDARGMGMPVPAPPREADRNIALHAAQAEARKNADGADDALIEIIRAELQGHPGPPVPQWEGVMPPDPRGTGD